MFNVIKFAMSLLALITFFFFIRNVISVMFSIDNSSLHKKRLKQLKFNNKRTSSDGNSQKELIDKITNPVATHVLPKLGNVGDMTKLEKDLEMAQWDKIFTPITFVSFDLMLKALGILLFAIFISSSWVIALLLFSVFFFLFKFLFRNSIKERKFRLISGFPDFIRITQGFLMSNIPLAQSVEKTLPYVCDEWRPLLQEFVVNSEVYSQNECITKLQNQVDIFEVRELWSLIKLNSEQGIDIKECFDNQAEKVRELQLDVMMEKIGKRQTMSILLQAPLLLTMIITFGLPTFTAMMNLGV